jgi:gamma-glutamyltranspeptidase/glutathione hydrolase
VHKNYQVSLEDGFSSSLAVELQRRQHSLIAADGSDWFGGGQIICRVGSAYCGASDGRKDGQAVGF